MSRAHFIKPTAPEGDVLAVRLGAGSGAANNLTQLEVGKFVKLAGESRYNLAAAGDEIEALIYSVEVAPQDGYTVGGVLEEGLVSVTFDGLQATPGVGAVVIGDFVVTGTAVAKGTVLPGYPKVCKATAAATALTYKWRVVSLGTAGTGAVGTVGVIKNIC